MVLQTSKRPYGVVATPLWRMVRAVDAVGGDVVVPLHLAASAIELVWLDGGYANTVDDSLIGWAADHVGVKLEVVKRGDDVHTFRVLPRRWTVERTFARISRCRRLARDYERLAAHAEDFIHLAMIKLMAARLAGQSVVYQRLHRKAATT